MTRASAIGGWHILTVGMILIFAFLLFRNSGIYPVVFSDEWAYSRFSRLMPLTEVTVPSYLYFYIYGKTSLCGNEFLGCARILNSVFFIAAMPLIYSIAKRVCSSSVAAIVAIISASSALNTYTAYFMPEAMYFFAFWGLSWVVLSLGNISPFAYGLLTGATLGLMALVKVHALFLFPGVIVFMAYSAYLSPRRPQKWQLLLSCTAVALGLLGVKLGLGYAAAGKSGLTLFGNLYGAQASGVMGVNRYVQLALPAIESLLGHLMALSLLFGLPLAAILMFRSKATYDSKRGAVQGSDVRAMQAYAICILVPLLLVTATFTASVAGSGPYESITRLHMRYYNFALPILFVIAASQFSSESIVGMRKWRAFAAFPVGVAIFLVIYTKLVPYTPSFIDSPELRGVAANSTVFYVLCGVSFLSLASWVYAARIGARFFVYIFMPLSLAFSNFYVNQELRQRLVPDVFDKAGIFTKQYLSSEDLSRIVVVGSEPVGLFRSLFYLDNPKASLETIPKGSRYDLAKLPAGKEWILVIGDHPLPDNTFYQLPMNGFTLARATGTDTIDFKRSVWPGVILNARGLYSAEPWGTWSSSDIVAFEFSMPLPEKFKVHLIAHAYGPNVGKEFVAHVGDSSVSFTLGAVNEEKVLEFDNPKRSKIISVNVPSPISPKELGLGEDGRSIGVGLVELRISPL